MFILKNQNKQHISIIYLFFKVIDNLPLISSKLSGNNVIQSLIREYVEIAHTEIKI